MRETPSAEPHVLVIVQNLPVPLDRRVWLECQALVANGYRVSVICPKGPGDPRRQVIDGIAIYKYRPAPEAKGLFGFAIEFAYSWIRTFFLSFAARRRGRFAVIQACNPPDTYWLLARLWRLTGSMFVFDQHDLNPELFRSRFGEPRGGLKALEYRALLWLERMTYRTADRVISTNESYARIARERGRKDAGHVTVVRSGPDTQSMRPIYPDSPRPSEGIELAYLGIMGPQDGVDTCLHVVDELVNRRNRRNVHATLMGFGDSYAELVALSEELGLADHVTFTGRADRVMIAQRLSRADIGLCPDLKTPLNDVSTMNKTMEYMAYALPSVSFDLVETRVSGADSVLYVPSGDVSAFADAVEQLMDDPKLRVEMGRRARARVSGELDWRPQARSYVGVFDALTRTRRGELVDANPLRSAPADEQGNLYVPLDDDAEFDRFIRERRSTVQIGATP
ncbi:glycosyltransferase family 4 protein [Microbacterium ureisolvens]|uniref:glycosyltransferase family 4 protein n=1 Tax=Microbacterium ureisolvens TaxID=2781186 RepID=UPI00362BFABE